MTQRDEREKLREADAEIQRLQDAKRRALAIADERAKENVALREALKNLLDAAKLMPRTTPKPGGAGTVHDYKIEAAYVWGLDRMCMAADATLSHAPPASEGVREKAANGIRTFCQSLGAGVVTMSAGVERIYYAGISLDALAVAVALAIAAPEPDATPDEGPDPLGYAKGERA